jgi:short-subunit dehydrogenase
MKLKGITVVVTGASRGIGRETARQLAQAGSNVVLASRDERALEELAGEIEPLAGRRLVAATDVTDREAVNATVERALQEFGSIEVLVNNAGLGLNAPVADGSLENIRRVFEVDVFGAIHCIQAVIPHMKERRRGTIVNVSSVMGRLAGPYNGAYSAAKAAVNALSDAMRQELRPHGIEVTVIYPGYTITDFHPDSLSEVKMPSPSRLVRGVGPEAVAKTIVQAVRSGRREAYVSMSDAAAIMVKNFAPRLVDWGMERLWLSSHRPEEVR